MITALAALISGVLLPLSLAPFDYWTLGIVALAAWFVLLRRPNGNGALTGWLFGVGKYGLGASWIYVSIHVYGNAGPPLAAFLVALFVAGLALFPMANGWLFRRLAGGDALADALLFAALFSGFEWLLTWFLTGFPWLFAGYAHLDTVLGGLAPVGGVLLVGFAVALCAAMLVAAVEALRERRRGRAAVALAMAAAPWLAGWVLSGVAWVQPGEGREVALVQGDVDQSVKWEPENRQAIVDTYLRLSDPYWGVDLMVWPEASLTMLAHQAGDVLAALDRRGKAAGTAVVLGIPAVERTPAGDIVFHNAAFALGTGHGRYVKRRLVPFGEYVPMEGLLRGLIGFFDLPMSHMGPGPWRQPLLDLGGDRGAMAICYEVVYPDLVRREAARADVLLTISNDTWFGRSIGPLQHVEMARMRALENGRWMLRDTNNGVTAVIDPEGRITARLPQFQEGVLRARYSTMTALTPFTRFGHPPLLALLAVAVITCARPSRAGWRRLTRRREVEP